MIRVLQFSTVFIVVSIMFLSFLAPVFAQAKNIEQRLVEIGKTGDKNKAIEHLTQLLSLPQITVKQHLTVLTTLSRTYHSLGDLSNALTMSHQAQGLAHDNDFKQEEADAYKLIGVYNYYKGDHTQALIAYKTSLAFYQSINSPVKQANLLNNIGLAHAALGELQQALSSYQLAEPLYQNHGSEEDTNDLRQNIAGLLLRLSSFDDAIKILHEVINNRIEFNDTLGVAMAKGDLGIAYKHSGQYEQAKRYTLEAMNYSINKNDHYNSASQMGNLAALYNLLGQTDNAIEYATKGIDLSKQYQHYMAYSACLHELALALFSKGQIEQAKEYITLSNQVAYERGFKDLLDDNLALSSLIFAVQNLTKDALATHFSYVNEKRKTTNDMLRNTLNDTINQQRAKYETQQLSRQVEQLTQNEKLLQLQKAQETQERNYIIIGLGSLILISFFAYRRHMEHRSKQELELRVKQRTHELEIANKKLLKLSLLDGLTSIHNRRSFDCDLMQIWRKTQRNPGTFLLLIADIDYFKLYNDKYGHVAGDNVLRRVAEVLDSQTRSEDRVYRYGGEEFAVIFKNHDFASANKTSSRILQEIRKLDIEHASSEHSIVTISAGICQFNENIESVEQIIELTDQRLYAAKKRGRNCLVDKIAV